MMHKVAALLMIIFLSCSVFASCTEASNAFLETSAGYRLDRLEWKTSFNVESDCELQSHLKWENIQIWQIEASGQFLTFDNIYLRASADYGWMMSGKNTDSDRMINFSPSGYSSGSELCNFEIAHSHSKSIGEVYDAKIAIGYQFKLSGGSLLITPLIGYSCHGQHLLDYHLKQIFYGFNEAVPRNIVPAELNFKYPSSHRGTNANYQTRWKGPFIGFDFDYRFSARCLAGWEFFGTYEFHWAVYNAKAKWNLRQEDFADGCFNHQAKNAYGSVFDIGIRWNFCPFWVVAFRGEFQWFWAGKGDHRVKIPNEPVEEGNSDRMMIFSLKNVRWQSAAIMIDVGKVF